ncbi:MAG: aminomethyl-transferring glycine dehydrogenase subunit GcvPB [Bacteriovoracaceae bacterium]|nr:aminomethyl-transferring glycine dehydrogenase subunit GcvPB [Bacteriovoracaceae bacterium]
MPTKYPNLPYDPTTINRELARHYISASDQDIDEMLKSLNLNSLSELFDHIDKNVHFDSSTGIGEELEYHQLSEDLLNISKKNKVKTSFIGDGLKNYKVSEIVEHVCNIRGLTTAYTPYQPERSQGTLHTLYLYSSAISMLTGFEAINSSLYDRSTCIFEAIQTARRIKRKGDIALVANTIYPGDIEVLDTQSKFTDLKIVTVNTNPNTGTIDIDHLNELISLHGNEIAAFVFPQVNSFGNLENVDTLTDISSTHAIQSIAVIDPMLLGTGGLKKPSEFGSSNEGCNLIVGEGQHLAIGPNCGGPGLGIFGIRYNDKNKTAIRSSAGRYVGKGKDEHGNEALCMVLSTREQHIRREKATSNICSNQSFVATIAGASILARGEKGMEESHSIARENARYAFNELTRVPGIKPAFEGVPFYNEFTLELPDNGDNLLNSNELQVGIDVSKRVKNRKNLLLVSLFDVHKKADIEKLITLFEKTYGPRDNTGCTTPEVPQSQLSSAPVGLPSFEVSELKTFYNKLGDLNVSPDDNIYPLGSCTMKYNPHINDWAAGLEGFTQPHPQAPEEDIQGCLQIIYHIQEDFKAITGLPGVTTQPVAGAQGELVGLKMFQAYHADKGEAEQRDIILIPRTAHGTNPATAAVAGYKTGKKDGRPTGIVVIDSNENGNVDLVQLKSLITDYGQHISGIMVTNPNTSGIFEKDFKVMSEMIHEAGGLVYMDGANMNAIAGWINLDKMGVDAVHNNLHKTWTIPHGGGGPGDAIVAVSDKLVDFLPGVQIKKENGVYSTFKTPKTIGSFHRHFGNFAHKVRAYTYLKALGDDGVKQMSAVAVLSAKYLYKKLKTVFPILPAETDNVPRMHEFILTLSKESFDRISEGGTTKATAIAKIGKLFLDFGLHAPTMAFPEIYGMMIEPTESYTKAELDRFSEIVSSIFNLINETPEILTTAPHFTPVGKVNEVDANKNLNLAGTISSLPSLPEGFINPKEMDTMSISEICQKIVSKHKELTQ